MFGLFSRSPATCQNCSTILEQCCLKCINEQKEKELKDQLEQFKLDEESRRKEFEKNLIEHYKNKLSEVFRARGDSSKIKCSSVVNIIGDIMKN